MEAGGDRSEPVGVVESSGGRGLLRNLQQATLPSVQSRGASRDSRGPWQRTRLPLPPLDRLDLTVLSACGLRQSPGLPTPLQHPWCMEGRVRVMLCIGVSRVHTRALSSEKTEVEG